MSPRSQISSWHPARAMDAIAIVRQNMVSAVQQRHRAGNPRKQIHGLAGTAADISQCVRAADNATCLSYHAHFLQQLLLG